jgi:hypothetical protein
MGRPKVAKFVLNRHTLSAHRERAGITSDVTLAAELGMNKGHVSRVLRGDDPGIKFLAGVAILFGNDAFFDIFEAVA